MNQNEREPRTDFRALHQCRHCGHLTSREDTAEVSIISGVFDCPHCGQASPLNVVIEDDGVNRPASLIQP